MRLAQLDSPSFQQGFARSPVESIRPDLWPDHAWVPAMGVQGGRIFDLAGNVDLTLPSGPIWVPGGIDWNGSDKIVPGLSTFQDVTFWGSIRILDTVGNDVIFTPDDGSGRPSFTAIDRGANVQLEFYSGNAISTGDLTIGRSYNYVLTADATTGDAKIFLDGELAVEGPSGILRDGTTFFFCNREDNARPSTAEYGSFSFVRSVLSPSQAADLSADPLLYLRRRETPILTVPGGAAIDVAISLARVMTDANSAGAEALAAVGLSRADGDTYTQVRGVQADITLALVRGDSYSATATALANVTLDLDLGYAIVAGAVADAGLSLGSIRVLSPSRFEINLDGRRVFMVSLQDRTLVVAGSDRTTTISKQGRTTTP